MKFRYLLILILMLSIKTFFGQVVINELLASNISSNTDTSDYLLNTDWLELHNTGVSALNIGGYFLSDDLADKTKWKIPEGLELQAGAYILFWADDKDKVPGESATRTFTESETFTISGYHLNFKLSSAGEAIGLFDAEGNLIDSLIFGMQKTDISYGRISSENNKLVYFAEPTPGKVNSTLYAESYSETAPPLFSTDGGFYPNAINLELSHHLANAVIYYSTDGSVPTPSSNLYTGSININYNKVVRARAFAQGELPGPVITHSYFINQQQNLPVVAISTNNGNLWDYNFGLFQNSFKNREVPISIEYFNKTGERKFDVNAGMRLFGSTIFELKQKPLSIYMKNKYGNDAIEHQLFSDKEIFNFKNIVLRNGGNDNGITFFRDAMITSLAAGNMDMDYQAYQPTVVFVNGEYWGIYNLREKMNEHYLASNHMVRPDHLDILENNAEVMEGNATDYLTLTNFIANNDISIASNYEYLKSQIDINEYINYKIIKTYIGYWLADINNKYWKPKSENGKWRWLLFDLEHAFGRNGSDSCQINTLEKISTNYSELPDWSTLLFRKLCENDQFRQEFIQRSASYLNTILLPEKVIAVIDSLENLYAPEMPKHINRWDADPMAIPSMISWKNSIEEMRDYAMCRNAQMREHILERFAISDTFKLTIHVPASDTAIILINGVQISDSIYSGQYFADVPLKIESVPNFGIESKGWQNVSQAANIELTLSSDTVLIPVFQTGNTQSILPAIIAHDTILTLINSPYLVNGDLIIDSNAVLTIAAGVEILMSDQSNIRVYGGLKSLGTESEAVVIQSNPHPNARIPSYNIDRRWGAICFHNSSDTSYLIHTRIKNTSYGFQPGLHKAAISGYNASVHIDQVTITDAYHPIYTVYGSTVIKNSNLSTTLTGDIINIKYADYALVENCKLKGNEAEDTDAIDFDQITSGAILNNKIYSFFGSNSDGIDLGENCQNILIQGNEIINCTDKAISVGQASTAIIKNNLVVNCAQGVGIKDSSSFAYIDKNTFYNNDFAVACFEKNLGKGGGSATIDNSILANARTSPVWYDHQSSIHITYSLSTTDELYGTGNLTTDPQFINAGIGNFQLNPNSPCINSGNPNSPLDPDNSRSDMGAYYTFNQEEMPMVIINEINFNSHSLSFSGDWIELHNIGTTSVDLSGWVFIDDNYQHQYFIPDGTMLAANDYLCICNNQLAFSQQFPGMNKFIADFKFGLDANEQVRLFDNNKQLVNAVSYNANADWPAQANGLGSSLELSSPELDNTIATNWHASYVSRGTPGFANSTKELVSNLFINELMAGNSIIQADNHEEFDDWIELYNASNKPINIAGLYLSDDFNNLTKWQIPAYAEDSTTVDANDYLLLWADDSVEQGILHTNFKLALTGEQLAISQIIAQDTVIIDSLRYGKQLMNIAFGRFPDGSPDKYQLYPTPDSTNILSKTITLNNIKLYPIPAKELLNIEIIDILNEEVGVSFINVLGQNTLHCTKTFNIDSNIQTIDVSSLAKGVYFLQLQIGTEAQVSKIVIQ